VRADGCIKFTSMMSSSKLNKYFITAFVQLCSEILRYYHIAAISIV